MKAEILTTAYLQPTFKQSKALQEKTRPFKKGILHFYTIYNGERASNQSNH